MLRSSRKNCLQTIERNNFLLIAFFFHFVIVIPKRRRILFLVNPKGGVGRAKTISDTIVKPMLEHSGLEVTEQCTSDRSMQQ